MMANGSGVVKPAGEDGGPRPQPVPVWARDLLIGAAVAVIALALTIVLSDSAPAFIYQAF
jgi:crotonobetainyl-CoA:carnitine CoA-transferase CaiB-like acyl-CoA transferase